MEKRGKEERRKGKIRRLWIKEERSQKREKKKTSEEKRK